MAKTKEDKPVDEKSGGGNNQGKLAKPYRPAHSFKTALIKAGEVKRAEDVTPNFDGILVNQLCKAGKVYACYRNKGNPREFVILCDGEPVSTQGTLRQAWEGVCRS